MKNRELGKSGIQASVIGLGTWAMGGWMWGGTNENEAIEAIQVSLDAGVTLIDTAPAYGLGKAEELVGKAIQGCRDKVVLVTKCGLVWHTQKGNHFFDEHDKPVHRYLGADSIRYELEQSLTRLKTDYLDLYITHWQDPTTPIEETMKTLIDLKKEGKIRAIGVSNVNENELKSYQSFGQVDAIQEKYNMLDRDLEAFLLPICQKTDVSILSYSSLALGLLTGKIGVDRQFKGDDLRINDPRFSVENLKKISGFFKDISPITKQYDLTIAQLVIAWTIAQSGITYALCGARNAQQAKENAKAGTTMLSTHDLQRLDDALKKYI